MTRGKQTEPGKRLWGHILVTVGVLWLVLCGACTTLGVVVLVSMTSAYPNEMIGILVQALVIGLVCAAPGLLLFLVGRQMAWPKRP